MPNEAQTSYLMDTETYLETIADARSTLQEMVDTGSVYESLLESTAKTLAADSDICEFLDRAKPLSYYEEKLNNAENEPMAYLERINDAVRYANIEERLRLEALRAQAAIEDVSVDAVRNIVVGAVSGYVSRVRAERAMESRDGFYPYEESASAFREKALAAINAFDAAYPNVINKDFLSQLDCTEVAEELVNDDHIMTIENIDDVTVETEVSEEEHELTGDDLNLEVPEAAEDGINIGRFISQYIPSTTDVPVKTEDEPAADTVIMEAAEEVIESFPEISEDESQAAIDIIMDALGAPKDSISSDDILGEANKELEGTLDELLSEIVVTEQTKKSDEIGLDLTF